MWNRLRYTLWAPLYDALVAAVGFDVARQRSIDQLDLKAADRVLIVGAGTGLDLPHLPPGIGIVAIDVTPAMLERLRRRAASLGLAPAVHVQDARRLPFADASFDAVILHLILAVMPEPDRGLAEAVRVLKPGGRIAVFDKFLGEAQEASLKRRLLNVVMKPLFTDMNRRFEPMVRPTGLAIERDDPVAFGGMYRLITLRKPHPGQ